MNTSQIKRATATGDITTDDAHLRAVVLTAGADAATATVRAGGSSGTVVLVLKAAINTTASATDLHDAFCAGGIHLTVGGTTPDVTFVYV